MMMIMICVWSWFWKMEVLFGRIVNFSGIQTFRIACASLSFARCAHLGEGALEVEVAVGKEEEEARKRGGGARLTSPQAN